ncbi:MAG: Smr/MutS family protein [Candidatus Ozemobacteraceae bacterium]
MENLEDVFTIPIDGTLDLHNFRPSEAADLVEDYLHECRTKNLLLVRLIHGKGTGQLREKVHARLRKLPWVESIEWPADSGNWGATLVRILP